MNPQIPFATDQVLIGGRWQVSAHGQTLPLFDPSDGGELTHSYSVESGGEVKMTKKEIIEMIQRAGFEAVERDTVYNRVDSTLAM